MKLCHIVRATELSPRHRAFGGLHKPANLSPHLVPRFFPELAEVGLERAAQINKETRALNRDIANAAAEARYPGQLCRDRLGTYVQGTNAFGHQVEQRRLEGI